MALISLQNVSIGFRGPYLLDNVSCEIEAGGRIGLLGRNGAGKSTLLKMLRGDIAPDHGSIVLSAGSRVAYLRQDVPSGDEQTVAQVVQSGLSALGEIDDAEWNAERLLEQTISRMELDSDAHFGTLSSGMKRRVLLAQAIVSQPELLLLDEPTNHLDISTIAWLEGFLSNWRGTLIFVTHDRAFLRKLATRILEIDRGQLFDWSCDYDTFLIRKESTLAAQEKQDALFDKRLAAEEAWIRQGIKARRTRNEGRVRALKALRVQRQERRDDLGAPRLNIETADRSGNLVAKLENVSFAYADRPILTDFSTSVMRGDKIGVIGPNGAGKTTLLAILLGQIAPKRGDVRLGTNLHIAYFDQLRDQLDDNQSVEHNIGDGRTTLNIGGKEKHVIGYLREFLFSPDRAQTQVKHLSGGERNRVLLARLFAKPSNVLVLDEPTNDLDTETLEMLESKLVAYDGTVLLVSHDRAFLNNVVTSTIVFENEGVREYVGGYDDWLAQRSIQRDNERSNDTNRVAKTKKPKSPETRRKLSYVQQRELSLLPAKIESLEANLEAMHRQMVEADYFRRAGEQIAADQAALNKLESALTETYARWEALEARNSG